MSVQSLAAQGPGTWVKIRPLLGYSQSVLCAVSAGASLTYTIEVSGDPSDVGATNVANVFPLDSAAVGLTASANFQIASQVWWVRPNITSYTSGTLTFQVAQ